MISDSQLKTAKPSDKPYKIAIENSMYMLVNPSGAKYFRLKYHFNGKEKLLALGVYPEVSLKQARLERDKAKILLSQGVDPLVDKQEVKETTIIDFKYVAREWLASTAHTVNTQTHQKKISHFERLVFPFIGDIPIGAINHLPSTA